MPLDDIGARGAIETAAPILGLKGCFDVLIEYAESLLDSAGEAGDKLARARAAHDHRALTNLREKLHN